MKTIYFHIGSPKAGSSTIQKFCVVNSQELGELGLHYPLNSKLFARNRLANGYLLASNFMDANTRTKSWDIYKREILQSNNKNVLISEEGLFLNPNLSRFCELNSDGLQFKFIIYIRKSFEYLCSFWSEMCRLHERGRHYIKYPISLERFLIEDERYVKDLEQISQLADLYGDENIIVRPFETTSFTNNDLLADFLSVFSIPMTDSLHRVNAQNTMSRSRKMLDAINLLQVANIPGSFLHEVNNSIIDPKDIDHDYETLMNAIGGSISAQESIGDEVIEAVTKKYSVYESAIAKRFLGKDKLFEDEFPSIYKKKRTNYTGLTAEDLLMINIFAQNKIYTLQPFYRKWLRKLEKRLLSLYRTR